MEKKEKDNEYVDFVVTARKYKTTLTAKYKNRKMWHKPFVGDVISAIFGTASASDTVAGSWSEVQTLIGIGVGIFLVRVSVGVVKSLVQGY